MLLISNTFLADEASAVSPEPSDGAACDQYGCDPTEADTIALAIHTEPFAIPPGYQCGRVHLIPDYSFKDIYERRCGSQYGSECSAEVIYNEDGERREIVETCPLSGRAECFTNATHNQYSALVNAYRGGGCPAHGVAKRATKDSLTAFQAVNKHQTEDAATDKNSLVLAAESDPIASGAAPKFRKEDESELAITESGQAAPVSAASVDTNRAEDIAQENSKADERVGSAGKSVDDAATAGEEHAVISSLPKTGGVSGLALGAGILLIFGGLVSNELVRQAR